MDINIGHQELPEFTLGQAFLVYKAPDTREVLVTKHRVENHRILPGAYVEPPAFIENKHAYWLQPGDVYRDNRTYVFTTPPKKQTLVYTGTFAKGVRPHLNGRVPQYMWALREGSLHVWRFRRHKDDYILLSPRLWNVSDDGSVCIGSMPRPKLRDGRKVVDDFWGSAFSHPSTHKHEWKGRLSTWLKSSK